MNENEQLEAAATAIAAFGLAQVALDHVMETTPAEKEKHLERLRRLIKANGDGGPANLLAASKLQTVLELYEKQNMPHQR